MHNHGNLYNDWATVILVNIMLLIRLPLVTIRSFSSGDARFVEKMRLLDYWKLHDTALLSEFPRSNLLLMVDRRPLVLKEENSFRLISNTYLDLKKKLGDYGVPFDITSSCLLDAVDGPSNDLIPLFGTAVCTVEPPEDLPIKKDDVMGELAKTLGGYFIDLRMAMLTMDDERQRNLLAKFQSLVRWSHIYRRCPRCASALRMRVSKSGAECAQCNRFYYPTFSPVAITLVTDHTDEYCMLVRHKGSASGVYTAVAGFAHSGESLSECARREVAEEVGLLVSSVRQLDSSQPWPMPDSSLMCAHQAIASREDKIEVCPAELESARWFSRYEVAVALKRTMSDPLLKGLPRELEKRQELMYIPPSGAIAHQMIRAWVEGRLSTRWQAKHERSTPF